MCAHTIHKTPPQVAILLEYCSLPEDIVELRKYVRFVGDDLLLEMQDPDRSSRDMGHGSCRTSHKRECNVRMYSGLLVPLVPPLMLGWVVGNFA